MATFDEFFEATLKDARKLLDASFRRGRKEAREILEAHAANSRERLRRWTKLLARGELTEAEFRLLVNNQVTLSRMRLRTVKVIGKKSALAFRDSLRDLIIDNAFEFFL